MVAILSYDDRNSIPYYMSEVYGWELGNTVNIYANGAGPLHSLSGTLHSFYHEDIDGFLLTDLLGLDRNQGWVAAIIAAYATGIDQQHLADRLKEKAIETGMLASMDDNKTLRHFGEIRATIIEYGRVLMLYSMSVARDSERDKDLITPIVREFLN